MPEKMPGEGDAMKVSVVGLGCGSLEAIAGSAIVVGESPRDSTPEWA
jgi:hypothetical protein